MENTTNDLNWLNCQLVFLWRSMSRCLATSSAQGCQRLEGPMGQESETWHGGFPEPRFWPPPIGFHMVPPSLGNCWGSGVHRIIRRPFPEYMLNTSENLAPWFSIGSIWIYEYCPPLCPQNWALTRESHPEKNTALSGSSDVDRIPFKFRQRAAPHRSCKLVRSSRTILTRETWPQSGSKKTDLAVPGFQNQRSKLGTLKWLEIPKCVPCACRNLQKFPWTNSEMGTRSSAMHVLLTRSHCFQVLGNDSDHLIPYQHFVSILLAARYFNHLPRPFY